MKTYSTPCKLKQLWVTTTYILEWETLKNPNNSNCWKKHRSIGILINIDGNVIGLNPFRRPFGNFI